MVHLFHYFLISLYRGPFNESSSGNSISRNNAPSVYEDPSPGQNSKGK